jgi:hypothetical protein
MRDPIRWLGIINLFLLGMMILSGVCFFFLKNNDPIPMPSSRIEQQDLPKSLFSGSEEFFQCIGDHLLSLTWVSPQMLLPDLRNELIFNGKNARPDAKKGKAHFHFSLRGSEEKNLIAAGERIYLVYQGACSSQIKKILCEAPSTLSGHLWGEITSEKKDISKSCYSFSPGNQPTPLWFEVAPLDEDAIQVKISMLDEKGILVSSPAHLRQFRLQMQDFPKLNNGWELSGQRVDSTLLVRQKARWVGADRFLEMHGGEDFEYASGKERIDFLEGETPYCCFVAIGDFLVWKNGRWHVASRNEDTQLLPLMIAKKIEDKIMTFELWDPEGRAKVSLSLIRIKDHNGTLNLSQALKFVGAKTWAQFIVESSSGDRMTLKLHDWLIYNNDTWKKLDSPEEIDAFVQQKISGPLFILDKMEKQNGRQVLLGHLFNSLRTEVENVELTSCTNTPLANFYRNLPMSPPFQAKSAEIMQGGIE